MAAYVESIRRAPRTLTEREQKALLRVTGEHCAGWRDHVLFAMALGTGLRAHELVALDVGDVFDDGGRVRRRLALRVFKGDGRGDDDGQEVLLPEGLRAKLERLRAWKAGEGESLDGAAPLFVSQRGSRLSTRQLRHAFAVWQERAGFERHVSLHALRHTACSSVYAASKDLRLTQRFARHRSVVTTMVYTHPSDDDLVRAVEQLRC
jgi:site-specific recombinase XerC